MFYIYVRQIDGKEYIKYKKSNDYIKYKKEDEFKKVDKNEEFYEFRIISKYDEYNKYLREEYEKYMRINKLEIIEEEDSNNEKMKIIGYILDSNEIIVKYI
jgi:hypothetical protein